MLDKQTTKFLATLAGICSDGSYKIIEKSELKDKDPNAVAQKIQYLSDNEMIDVKYIDEKVYCLTVLPKGRTVIESNRRKTRTVTRLEKKIIAVLIVGCFLASIIGAMLGALIARSF